MRSWANQVRSYWGSISITGAAGNNPLTINTTPSITAVAVSGAAASQLNILSAKQGAQAIWTLYQPASDTSIRLNNGADQMVVSAVGLITAAGGLVATTGGITATAGGLTVSAGGASITGALTQSGGAISLTGATTITDSTGTQWGAPTGGAQGAGTINVAGGLFVNGASVATGGPFAPASGSGNYLQIGGNQAMTGASGGAQGSGTVNAVQFYVNGGQVLSLGNANNTQVGTVVIKTKNAATNRASVAVPANDPDLTYVIPANGTYRIELVIPYTQNGVTTNGIAGNINYSGTITAGSQGWYTGSTAGQLAGQPISSAVGTVVFQGTFNPAGGTVQATGDAVLVCASGGTLAFSWSQQSSVATNTSVLQGASMIVTRIA
jgi:fibronectin-binding autotransporter adhesin